MVLQVMIRMREPPEFLDLGRSPHVQVSPARLRVCSLAWVGSGSRSPSLEPVYMLPDPWPADCEPFGKTHAGYKACLVLLEDFQNFQLRWFCRPHEAHLLYPMRGCTITSKNRFLQSHYHFRRKGKPAVTRKTEAQIRASLWWDPIKALPHGAHEDSPFREPLGRHAPCPTVRTSVLSRRFP